MTLLECNYENRRKLGRACPALQSEHRCCKRVFSSRSPSVRILDVFAKVVKDIEWFLSVRLSFFFSPGAGVRSQLVTLRAVLQATLRLLSAGNSNRTRRRMWNPSTNRWTSSSQPCLHANTKGSINSAQIFSEPTLMTRLAPSNTLQLAGNPPGLLIVIMARFTSIWIHLHWSQLCSTSRLWSHLTKKYWV